MSQGSRKLEPWTEISERFRPYDLDLDAIILKPNALQNLLLQSRERAGGPRQLRFVIA